MAWLYIFIKTQLLGGAMNIIKTNLPVALTNIVMV